MTPAMVVDIAQKSPSSPAARPGSSPKGENASAVLVKDSKSIAVDTVSLSPELQQASADPSKKEAKIDEPNTLNNSDTPTSARSMAQVQFVYDLKGDLSVRYMDTADRLIYQVPSEFVMRMKEIASNTNSPVDTKA